MIDTSIEIRDSKKYIAGLRSSLMTGSNWICLVFDRFLPKSPNKSHPPYPRKSALVGTYARDGPAAPHHAVQIDIPSEPRPRLVGSSSPNAFQHPNAKPAWSTDAPVGFGGKLAQASRGRQGSTRSVTESPQSSQRYQARVVAPRCDAGDGGRFDRTGTHRGWD